MKILNGMVDDGFKKSEMTNFYWRVKEIPTSIKIRGDFYGFTGWRPFVFYIVTLILLAYVAAFS